MDKKDEGAPTRRAKDQRRIPLSMRVTPEIRERLVAQAEARGRSITQEAEVRLEQSLADEDQLYATLSRIYGRQFAGLLILIGEALRNFGPHWGLLKTNTPEGAENWLDEPYCFEQTVEAIKLALDAVRPEGDPVPSASMLVGRGGFNYPLIAREMGRMAVRTYLSAVAQPDVGTMPRVKEVATELRKLLGPAAGRIAKYLEREKTELPDLTAEPTAGARPSPPEPCP